MKCVCHIHMDILYIYFFFFFSSFFFSAVSPVQMCAHFNWNGKHECDSHLLLLLQQTQSSLCVCVWKVCRCVCVGRWAAASAAYLIYTPIYTCSLLLLLARRRKNKARKKAKQKSREKPHKPPTLWPKANFCLFAQLSQSDLCKERSKTIIGGVWENQFAIETVSLLLYFLPCLLFFLCLVHFGKWISNSATH